MANFPLFWRRLIVVLCCYAISYYGFMLILMGARDFAVHEASPAKFLPLVWLSAWLAHVIMSVAWVRDRKVRRFWPVAGTAAALIGFASPSIASLLSNFLLGAHDSPIEASVLALIVFVFLLPSVGLAIWLVRFHLRPGGAATR